MASANVGASMAMIWTGAVTVELVPACADGVGDSVMERLSSVNGVDYAAIGDLRIYRKT
jgi:hypothetical protein